FVAGRTAMVFGLYRTTGVCASRFTVFYGSGWLRVFLVYDVESDCEYPVYYNCYCNGSIFISPSGAHMNEGRGRILQAVFVFVGIIFLVKLFFVQVADSSYADMADSNAILRKIDYPVRGLIKDRN